MNGHGVRTSRTVGNDEILPYIPLARKIASAHSRRWSHVGITTDELLSYALEGILIALGTFDPKKGVPVAKWVAIRISRRVMDGVRDLRPTSRSGIRRRTLPVGGEFELNPMDRRWNKSDDRSDAKDRVERMIGKLGGRAKEILHARFVEGAKAADVARRFGVKVETIYCMTNLSIKCMRDMDGEG